jgi:hypothetical protein
MATMEPTANPHIPALAKKAYFFGKILKYFPYKNYK